MKTIQINSIKRNPDGTLELSFLGEKSNFTNTNHQTIDANHKMISDNEVMISDNGMMISPNNVSSKDIHATSMNKDAGLRFHNATIGDNKWMISPNHDFIINNRAMISANDPKISHSKYNIVTEYQHKFNFSKPTNRFFMLATTTSDKDPMDGKDADFRIFIDNLFLQCDTNKVAWHIPAAELVPDFQTALTDYDTADDDCTPIANASPNKKSTRASKRSVLEGIARPFRTKWIVLNDYMTVQNAATCGVKKHTGVRTKMSDVEGTPSSFYINKFDGLTMKYVYAIAPGSEGNKKVTKKPDNVYKIEVATLVLADGDTGTHSPEECTDENRVLIGRTPAKKKFKKDDNDKKGLSWCRYIGHNGSKGEWLGPIPFRVGDKL